MRNKDHDQHVDTVEDADHFAEDCHIEHINIDISKHEDDDDEDDNANDSPEAGTGPRKDGVECAEQLDGSNNDPGDEEMSPHISPHNIILTEAIHSQSQGNQEEDCQNNHIISLNIQRFSVCHPNVKSNITITTLCYVIFLIVHVEKENSCSAC